MYSKARNTCIRNRKTLVLTFAFCVIGIVVVQRTLKRQFRELKEQSKRIPTEGNGFINPDFKQDVEGIPDHPPWDLTVVTAFFNLGSIQKGEHLSEKIFTTDTYQQWSKVFGYLINPLVVYTDSDYFKNLMQAIRRPFSDRTKILLINRNSSWAFANQSRIENIFKQKGYPKFYPNTINPLYACVQHAKYDVTARAARENYFKTKYITWIDIGYFRSRYSTNYFQLVQPLRFNDSLIAMNLINFHPMSTSPEKIFKQNMVWVGGGLFYGRRNKIIELEKQYRHAINFALSKQLMNTDQQVLFAMYSNTGRKAIKPNVELQLYRQPPINWIHFAPEANQWSYLSHEMNEWFYLGLSMIKEWIPGP